MNTALTTVATPRQLRHAGLPVIPSLFAGTGERGAKRFIEFFTANIRNKHTRKAYARAVADFADWCDSKGLRLEQLDPFLVAAYIEELGQRAAKPTVKQHLAAIRMLFDWLVTGQIVPLNPAHAVRGPTHVVKKGKTPVLTAEEARLLLETLVPRAAIVVRVEADKKTVVVKLAGSDVEQAAKLSRSVRLLGGKRPLRLADLQQGDALELVYRSGEIARLRRAGERLPLAALRDRAFIAVMTYSFARVGAVVGMNVEDYYEEGKRHWFRLHEKGGKRHEVPVHHKAQEYLEAYLAVAGITKEPKSPLFRTIDPHGQLTERRLQAREVLAMIKRRAQAAGLSPKVCCHTFRATGITAYLDNGGSIEHAQRIAAHESPRTTKLYDRTGDQISLDEIERIVI
jgi:site-specific recombinase XerD